MKKILLVIGLLLILAVLVFAVYKITFHVAKTSLSQFEKPVAPDTTLLAPNDTTLAETGVEGQVLQDTAVKEQTLDSLQPADTQKAAPPVDTIAKPVETTTPPADNKRELTKAALSELQVSYTIIKDAVNAIEASNEPWENYRKSKSGQKGIWKSYVMENFDLLMSGNQEQENMFAKALQKCEVIAIPDGNPSLTTLKNLIRETASLGQKRIQMSTKLIKQEKETGQSADWKEQSAVKKQFMAKLEQIEAVLNKAQQEVGK